LQNIGIRIGYATVFDDFPDIFPIDDIIAQRFDEYPKIVFLQVFVKVQMRYR